MFYSNLSKTIALAVGVLATVFLIGYFVFAWTEPTQPPPGGNVPAPINVGNDTQYKSGALGIGGLFQTDGETHLAITDGDVGIGTTAPGAKLEVAGQIKITGGSPGTGKVLTSDASGLASWQTAPGGGGASFVTFTSAISYNTCINPAGYTWGDLYPDAVAAGYKLSQCLPVHGPDWITCNCHSDISTCTHCYTQDYRGSSPGATATWTSQINLYLHPSATYANECLIPPIRCIVGIPVSK
jgi:hypothetical protein